MRRRRGEAGDGMRRPSHHCWGNKIPCLLFVGVTVRRKSIFKGQKQVFKNKLTSLGCWTPTPLTYDSVQKYVLWSLFMMEKGLLGLFLKCRLDHCKVSVENSGGKCRRWNSWGTPTLVKGNEPLTLNIGMVIVIVIVWLLQKSLFTAFLIWSLFIPNRANSPKVGKTFMTMMSRWTGEH